MPKLKSVPSAKSLKHIVGTLLTDEIDGVRCFTTFVPIDEFLDESVFLRNTHQRDEELRVLKHLNILKPEHLQVHVLQSIDGNITLIDGHSRRYTWSKNKLIRPTHVELRVFDVIDRALNYDDEELRLYNNHDSRRAVKTSAHTVQGAMNALSIDLNTKWMRVGMWMEALRKAAHFVDGAPASNDQPMALVEFFREELEAMDNIVLKKGMFVAPFISAAFIILHSKKDRERTEKMLRRYSDGDRGSSVGAKYSPHMLLAKLRDEGQDGTGTFGASKGKFGTKWEDMENFVPIVLSLMLKCRDEADTVFALDDPKIAPLSRKEILAL